MFERFANRVPRDVATVVSGRCHFHPDGQGYTTHCVFKNNRAVVVQSIIRDYDYGTYSDPFKHYQVMCRTLNKTLELVVRCLPIGRVYCIFTDRLHIRQHYLTP